MTDLGEGYIQELKEMELNDTNSTNGGVISKTELKKKKKWEEIQRKKEEKAKQRENSEQNENKNTQQRQQALENAKNIILTQDPSLPEAKALTLYDIYGNNNTINKEYLDKRIKLKGWVSTYRHQGKLLFIELRDGTGYPCTIQCVLQGTIAKCYNGLTLSRETLVELYGILHESKLNKYGGLEQNVDYWEVISSSSSSIENVYNEESNVDVLLDNRHLVIRESKNSIILKQKSILLQCLREYFYKNDYYEVIAPTIVQNQVEGGSTLFHINYFGQDTYLTQSSQLYLEAAVPSMRRVFCCLPSYRAEKSRTRRHLSEYTHFEAEVGFVTFDELLQILEDLLVTTCELMESKAGSMIRYVNPKYKSLERGFISMRYTEAIQWLCDNNIINEETGKIFTIGDDITEAPERKMVDTINKPIFLHHFPTDNKPFYMARDKDDPSLTESVDLLLPSVGEIVGGSIRSINLELMLENMKKEKIDPSTYYWYTDLRKYGACCTGGWGLGVERLLCWFLGIYNIRDACLFPRFIGRAFP